MKKILLILFATSTLAQPKEQEHYLGVSTAFDIRNAAVGSSPTNDKPALDLLCQFMIVSHNIEVNIGYERFNAISFDKYTIGVGYHFPLYGYAFGRQIKTVFIPSIEATLIDRWGTHWQGRSSHYTLGGNIALRWHLSDKVAVEWLTNALPRTDLYTKYPTLHESVPVVISNYLKFIYKL